MRRAFTTLSASRGSSRVQLTSTSHNLPRSGCTQLRITSPWDQYAFKRHEKRHRVVTTSLVRLHAGYVSGRDNVVSMPVAPQQSVRYAYLGPEGTFTEAALLTLPEAAS